MTTGPAFDDTTPVFVISVAARLAGMHPQTLRQYDRIGLVSPDRTAGRGRRYSNRDVNVLRQVQQLSQDEGINLAGIKRILELEDQVDALRHRLTELAAELDRERARSQALTRVFAAGTGGDVSVVRPGRRPDRSSTSGALVLWRPQGGRHH